MSQEPIPVTAAGESTARRVRLRVAAKLMLLVAFFSIVYMFVTAFLTGDQDAGTKPAFRVAIDTLAPGQTRQLTWEGRPVVIHHRTSEDVASLAADDERLADPDSADSQQPDWVDDATRSREAEWFVVIGVGMDFSCPIEYLPPSEKLFLGKPWSGGYVDTCRGSRYDQAGRVYQNQFADENLIVPDYDITADAVMLVQ